MSFALKIAPFSSTNGSCRFFSKSSISRVSTRFNFQKLKRFSSSFQFNLQRLFSTTSNGNACDMSDVHNSSTHHDGSRENTGSHKAKPVTPNEMMQKLRRYGISGILSYGLLNTIYYFSAFLLVWFYVAPAPGRMGYAAVVKRFLKVMAMVWAGSQVSKLVRAGGALALAPFVDRGLSWFTLKFNFETQAKAFMAIVGICFGLALVLFFVVTLLWA